MSPELLSHVLFEDGYGADGQAESKFKESVETVMASALSFK